MKEIYFLAGELTQEQRDEIAKISSNSVIAKMGFSSEMIKEMKEKGINYNYRGTLGFQLVIETLMRALIREGLLTEWTDKKPTGDNS